ncbi:hypothetical protein PINS_up014716 [Pythium insidiosum]|nr:hypothetical protein PINS_up014716 [Pythium insidiosum]
MEQMIRRISSQSSDIAEKCDQPQCRGKNVKEVRTRNDGHCCMLDDRSLTGRCRNQRTIHRFPMVFAMSVLWATNNATKEQIQGLLANISERVDLAKCFDASGPAIKFRNGGIRTTYRLRGFVCYYGRHYIALFYSTAHKAWLLFDDSRVLEIGPWEKVEQECLKGRFQIVLVFYELPDQRKDSSVSLFSSLSSSPSSLLHERKKSSSISSIQGDLNPPAIQESLEEDAPSPRRPSQLASVMENDVTGSPPTTLAGQLLLRTGSSSSASDASTTMTTTAAALDPRPSVIVDVPTNRDAELAQLQRMGSTSSQDILPVSAAIAMQPRTIAMNSPPGPDEYDVRFGEDAVILGMYLEKIGSDLCVTSFPRGAKDEPFGAEACGQIGLFDLVLQANGHPLQHYPVDRALKMIKAQCRPLVIRFRRSARVTQLTDMGFSPDAAVRALHHTRGDVPAAATYCMEHAGSSS